MKQNSLRKVMVLVTIGVSLTIIVLLTSSRFTQVIAQEDGPTWVTSAEAPAGMPLDRLSPADSLVTVNQEDAPDDIDAPDALISWRTSGASLKPRENDVSYTVNSSGSCTYATAGDASTVWNITPALPQGAVVDTLRMYYYDTSGSNATAYFTIYDLYGVIVDEWSVSSSGSGGNSFNDSAAINHTIDYSVYSYLINWRPIVTGSTLQLCGFRVFYEPPPFGLAFLPSIIKTP
jgi:hypothetical protein